MSLEQNKALVRRLMEEDISGGNESIVEEIIHPDFYDHANPPGMERGIEGRAAVGRRSGSSLEHTTSVSFDGLQARPPNPDFSYRLGI